MDWEEKKECDCELPIPLNLHYWLVFVLIASHFTSRIAIILDCELLCLINGLRFLD